MNFLIFGRNNNDNNYILADYQNIKPQQLYKLTFQEENEITLLEVNHNGWRSVNCPNCNKLVYQKGNDTNLYDNKQGTLHNCTTNVPIGDISLIYSIFIVLLMKLLCKKRDIV